MYINSLDSAARLTIGSAETWLVGPTDGVGGAYCVMHQILPAGLVSPAHRHTHEDQVAIVLAGRLGYWVEGADEREVSAGGLVARPRGLFHAVWNTWEEPATILEITSPGESFERWMRELSGLNESGRGDEASVRAIAAERYGIEFAGPDDPAGSRGHGRGAAAGFWQR
jgi:quercetin dioxygenase-like cupin family protein